MLYKGIITTLILPFLSLKHYVNYRQHSPLLKLPQNIIEMKEMLQLSLTYES